MCFRNDGRILSSQRKRRGPIEVWKRASAFNGIMETCVEGHKVIWAEGKIVKPHKTLKPLKSAAAIISFGLTVARTKPALLWTLSLGLHS